MRNFIGAIVAVILTSGWAAGETSRSSYQNKPFTGTTDPQGIPLRQGSQVNSGNTNTVDVPPSPISGEQPAIRPDVPTRNGMSSAPSGNPGATGSSQIPSPAPTTGAIGANGSGSGGAPGAISNSGTQGIKGSGR